MERQNVVSFVIEAYANSIFFNFFFYVYINYKVVISDPRHTEYSNLTTARWA